MVNLRSNLLSIDGYKLDHRRQYPSGTEFVYSNWTPRSTRVPGVGEVVFLGLQYFLKQYLGNEWGKFFAGNVDEYAGAYTAKVNAYLGPNAIGNQHLRDLHALGYLPLKFSAIPEGSSVPIGVPQMVVENTDPRFGWLVNYFETILSCVLWLPCTSATTARRFRKMLEQWADLTGSPKEFVPWQGHDFSFRGMGGLEAACLSGMGHLTSFTGTDTIPAVEFVEQFYPGDNGLIGGSVPATEHSVMCAGLENGELETFNRLLDLYPSGILSVVSDTWDLWNVITNILPKLKDKIMARNGKLVIRPDSGDPVKIMCGDPEADPGTPQHQGVVRLLHGIFGGTLTSKGFAVLDSHIGTIYGDGISYDRGLAILGGLYTQGFAPCNVVFGVGSYTYQYVTRDTFGFAMKATSVVIDGETMPIFKKPVTDDGGKFSAKGRLAVLRNEPGKLYLVNEATPEQEAASELKPVWENGKFLRTYTFAEVRENVIAR